MRPYDEYRQFTPNPEGGAATMQRCLITSSRRTANANGDNHRHNKYLDTSLAARPHVNGAAILVRATLHKSHIGTDENIPDSSAAWGSTDRHTSIKTDLGVLSFTGKTEQLFLDVFWSFLALC